MKINELEFTGKADALVDINILLPLQMKWNPQPDITAYEMAKSIPYLLSHTPTFPDQIDINEPHFRHFEIINLNK